MATIHADAAGTILAIYTDDESVPTGAVRPPPPPETAVTAVIDSEANADLLARILTEWRPVWKLHREGKGVAFRRHGEHVPHTHRAGK